MFHNLVDQVPILDGMPHLLRHSSLRKIALLPRPCHKHVKPGGFRGKYLHIQTLNTNICHPSITSINHNCWNLIYDLNCKRSRLDYVDGGDKGVGYKGRLGALGDGDGVALSFNLYHHVLTAVDEDGVANLNIWDDNIMVIFVIFLVSVVSTAQKVVCHLERIHTIIHLFP